MDPRAALGKDVVLVALTGWGEQANAERSKQAGIDRYLLKPVEFAELERTIAELHAQKSPTPR